MSLVIGLFVLFVYLFKEPGFSFFDLCHRFNSFSFSFALIFMIYFLLLALGFVCSSLSCCFRCKGSLREIFLFP